MIRNIKMVFSGLIFISLINSHLVAQSEMDDRIMERLKAYCSSVPYEEIYVHTDREDYMAGEDMWLKIYVIDRQNGKPSDKSMIAYFELLNPENFPVIQKRMIIRNGSGPGNVILPDTLSSGTYTCRMYTNWMRNFLPGNCFMKSVNIYNPFRNISFKRKVVFEKHLLKDLNIEFFPEGGTLLNGVPSRVAVKVSDRYQRGLEYSGVVRDIKGDSVAFFKTDHYGISSFKLIPSSGNLYYVLSEDTVTYLPKASGTGYALKVNKLTTDSVSLIITTAGNIISGTDKGALLFIHTNGNADYSQYLIISGKNVNITIPRTKLSPGINHITLFGNDGTPLCERFIFTRRRNLAELNISGSDNYHRREKVILDFDLGKSVNIPSKEASFSLSVAPQSPGLYSMDIDDHLVFGTEFGYLPWEGTENKLSDINENIIDDFLITANSRWLSWDKILSGKTTSFGFMAEKEGHFLTGLLKRRNSADIDTGSMIYLSIPGKVATFQYARPSSTGDFYFLLPVDYSRKDLIIQPAVPDDNITIQIESSFSWKLPESVSFIDSVNKESPYQVSNFSAGYQISKIYGTSRRIDNQEVEEKIPAKRRFYGIPEQELIMDDYIKLPVMEEIFFELTPGIRLRSRKSGYEMRVIDPVDNVFHDDSPLVMIDGVVINDPELIANLDPEIVERIDAIRTPYLTGDLVHYGIINVITRTGNLRNITLPDYAARLTYRIADPFPGFYSPEYSDPVKEKSRIPDFRNTLFWNPTLKPDADGRVRIEFWTSDCVSDYIVNVQGITNNGDLIAVKKIIKVD